MSEKRHKAAEEEGGGEVGLWYVSFADMITLLLSFFVMLTSFSSFDKESMKKINDTSVKAYPSVMSSLQSGRNSVVDQGYSCPVQTHGTENAAYPTWGVEQPTTRPTAARDFSERKIISIPLSSMFLGSSCALAPSGTKCVELLAKYLSATPYRIRLAVGGTDRTLALARQWKVASLLVEKGVKLKHVGLAPPDPAGGASRTQLVLTMLPEGAFR